MELSSIFNSHLDHDFVISAVFQEKENTFLTVNRDGTITQVTFQPKFRQKSYKVTNLEITSMEYEKSIKNSNSKRIILGSSTGDIIILSSNFTILKIHKNKHSNRIIKIKLIDNNRYFLTASFDGTLKLFNFQTDSYEYLASFYEHQGDITDIAISPDQTKFLTSCSDKKLRIFDLQKNRCAAIYGEFPTVPTSTLFHQNSKYYFVGFLNGLIATYKIKSGKLIKAHQVHQAAVSSMAISHSGQFLVSVSVDSTVSIIELKHFSIIYSIFVKQKGLNNVLFSHDDQLLMTTSITGRLTIWSFPFNKLLTRSPSASLSSSDDEKPEINANNDFYDNQNEFPQGSRTMPAPHFPEQIAIPVETNLSNTEKFNVFITTGASIPQDVQVPNNNNLINSESFESVEAKPVISHCEEDNNENTVENEQNDIIEKDNNENTIENEQNEIHEEDNNENTIENEQNEIHEEDNNENTIENEQNEIHEEDNNENTVENQQKEFIEEEEEDGDFPIDPQNFDNDIYSEDLFNTIAMDMNDEEEDLLVSLPDIRDLIGDSDEEEDEEEECHLENMGNTEEIIQTNNEVEQNEEDNNADINSVKPIENNQNPNGIIIQNEVGVNDDMNPAESIENSQHQNETIEPNVNNDINPAEFTENNQNTHETTDQNEHHINNDMNPITNEQVTDEPSSLNNSEKVQIPSNEIETPNESTTITEHEQIVVLPNTQIDSSNLQNEVYTNENDFNFTGSMTSTTQTASSEVYDFNYSHSTDDGQNHENHSLQTETIQSNSSEVSNFNNSHSTDDRQNHENQSLQNETIQSNSLPVENTENVHVMHQTEIQTGNEQNANDNP